jgi:hypothetical protein
MMRNILYLAVMAFALSIILRSEPAPILVDSIDDLKVDRPKFASENAVYFIDKTLFDKTCGDDYTCCDRVRCDSGEPDSSVIGESYPPCYVEITDCKNIIIKQYLLRCVETISCNSSGKNAEECCKIMGNDIFDKVCIEINSYKK